MKVLLGLASLLLGVTTAFGVELKMSVGSAVYKDMISKVEGPFEKKTGIKIVHTTDTSKITPAPETMRSVLEGKAEVALAAISFDDWVASIKKTGNVPANVNQLTYRVVGSDLIHIFVHPKNGVKALTLDQVGALFSGKAKNWKEVGGADLPVTIVRQDNTVARDTVITKKFLGGKEFPSNTTSKKDYSMVVDHVAANPGTFGYLPEKYVANRSDVVLVKTDEIGRPITMITVGKPSEKAAKLESFIRNEGKDYISGKKQ